MLLRSEVRRSFYAQAAWRREALHLAALFMEGPWLIVWFMVVQSRASEQPAVIGAGFVIANLLVGLALTRIAINQNLPPTISKLLSLGGAFCAIAISTMVFFSLSGGGR